MPGVLAVFPRWPGEAADDDQGPAVAPATTVLDGPAEDSALRLGAERRAGVVPGLGGEGFLPQPADQRFSLPVAGFRRTPVGPGAVAP